MIKRNLFIIILLLIAKSISAQSEEIKFYQIPVLENLDHAVPEQIFQDKEGFMWFVTWNGLFKFDGYKLTSYKPDPIEDSSISESNLAYGKIIEDSRGNIWILQKLLKKRLELFDKNKNQFFQLDASRINPDSTGSLEIRDLLEDAQRNIWLGTNKGLFKCSLSELYKGINTGTQPEFEQYTHDPDDSFSLSNNNINTLVNDSLGNLWIGTSMGLDILIRSPKGLQSLDASTPIFRKVFTTRNDTISKSNNLVSIIHPDGYNNIWFVTNRKAIYKIPKEEYVNILNGGKPPLIEQIVHTAPVVEHFITAKDKIWLASMNGLFIANLDNEQNPGPFIKYDKENSSISGNEGCFLLPDMAGNIWVSEFYDGVDIILNEKDDFSYFTDKEGISIWGIAEDHQQRLWFGTVGNGLYMLDRNKNEFRNYRKNPNNPNSLKHNYVYNIIEDSNNYLWIGNGHGLDVVDLNQKDEDLQFNKYLHDPDDSTSIFKGKQSSFYLDSQKNLWIGGDGGGLARVCTPSDQGSIDISKFSFENHYLNPIKPGEQNSLHCIVSNPYYESHNLFWIGTMQGLYLFNRGEELSVHLDLPTDKYCPAGRGHIACIYLEDEHTLWLGTAGSGLGKLMISDSSASNNRDSNTRIQFSSFMINGERFYYTVEWFTDRKGLVDNAVFGIVADENGNLWLSTGKGICRFNPSTETFKEFVETQDQGFVYYAYHKNSSGETFFGGPKKLMYFHPDHVGNNTYIPPVYITDFKLFNKIVHPGKDSPLKCAITNTEDLDLSYKENYLSFEFVALNYYHPEENQYKYRMIGLDTDTVYAGNRRLADYPDMKPGKYTFWVTGSNNDGVWNENGRSINIIIHPPWYKANLAFGSYGVLFFLSLFGFINWRTQSLKKDKEVLEGQVKDRTKEIEKQKEKLESTLENLKITQTQLVQSEKMASLGGLVAGVAHEINTPVGIGVTAVSSLLEDTRHMADLYKKEQISRGDFKEFLQTTNNSARLIQKNLDRTAQLVQSFKQVSVDQSSEEKREFLFKEYLEDVIRSLYPKFKNRDIRINIDCNEKLKLNSFPGVYAQIFTNLVLNSITHGFPGEVSGRIDILVKQKNKELSIEYKDNGKGIPKDILPRIFDPFFTTDQSKGTGLGLNIVYNLVTQKLKGRINSESEDKKEIMFRIVVPVEGKKE